MIEIFWIFSSGCVCVCVLIWLSLLSDDIGSERRYACPMNATRLLDTVWMEIASNLDPTRSREVDFD